MFGQNPFYHDTFKKYTAIFGTLFNEIYINRTNSNDDRIQTIKVPITYAPKDKMLARLEVDPQLNKPVAITLPYISFELSSIINAPSRKLSTLNKRTSASRSTIYTGVPYDINYSLYIYVKYIDDGTQILEQILPYFTPEFTVSADMIPELVVKEDIPIILNSVMIEDRYEGKFEDNRIIMWHLDFTLMGSFWGPVRTPSVIKFANVTFIDTTTTNTAIDRVTVQPGMDANGNPTTNSSITIPYQQIEANDNYDYITKIIDPNRNI